MSAEPTTENAIEVTAMIVPPEKPKLLHVLKFAARRQGTNSITELSEGDRLRQARPSRQRNVPQSRRQTTR